MKLSNLITNIRNAAKANKLKTRVKMSKNNVEFLEILRRHKFINGYFITNNSKVDVYLKYNFRKPSILNFFSLEQSTCPLYYTFTDLWKFDKDLGFIILTTSKGIITHKKALKKGVGGKALAYII